MTALVFYPGILLPVVTPIDTGTNSVTVSTVSTFNVDEQVTISSSSSWTLFANIENSTVSDFNVRSSVIVNTGFQSQGYLPRPVSWPIDYRKYVPGVNWNVYDPVSSNRISRWNLIQRAGATKLSTFNVSSSSAHASVSSSFRTHSLVQVQSVLSEWNLRKSVTAFRRSSFNALISGFAQKISLFNANGILVTPSVRASWNVKQQVSSSVLSKFQLPARWWAIRKSSFQVLSSVTVSGNVRYGVHGTVQSQSVSCEWNLRKTVMPAISSRWSVRSRLATNSNVTSWRVLSQLWKFRQSSFRVGINPNGQVSSSVQSSFNTLLRINRYGTAHWITAGNVQVAPLSRYNVLSPVLAQVSSMWVIGPSVNGRIRQLAQERIDFAY